MKPRSKTIATTCPICNKSHELTVETWQEIPDDAEFIKGVSQCQNKQFTVCFTMIGGIPTNISTFNSIPDIPKNIKMNIASDYVKKVITKHLNMNCDSIDVYTRDKDVVFCRNMFFRFMKMKYPKMSLNGLASFVKTEPVMNHATVIHAKKELDRLMSDPTEKYRQEILLRIENELFPKSSSPTSESDTRQPRQT